jgi:hypothetical protein
VSSPSEREREKDRDFSNAALALSPRNNNGIGNSANGSVSSRDRMTLFRTVTYDESKTDQVMESRVFFLFLSFFLSFYLSFCFLSTLNARDSIWMLTL